MPFGATLAAEIGGRGGSLGGELSETMPPLWNDHPLLAFGEREERERERTKGERGRGEREGRKREREKQKGACRQWSDMGCTRAQGRATTGRLSGRGHPL
jgi:hypothetical protein